jgi:excisionase family DNA binding protein
MFFVNSYDDSHMSFVVEDAGSEDIMNQEIRQPMTIQEAAHELRVSDQIVRKALLRGELEGFRIGKFWRIKPESVEKKLRGNAA